MSHVDTLKIYKAAIAAGFTEQQATFEAESLDNELEHVVTKEFMNSKFDSFKNDIDSRFDSFKSDIDSRFDFFKKELKQELSLMEKNIKYHTLYNIGGAMILSVLIPVALKMYNIL